MAGASDQSRAHPAGAGPESAAPRRRLVFLAEVGRLIAGSADPDQMLAGLAQLAVGDFADRCTVELAEDDAIHRAADAPPVRDSDPPDLAMAIDQLCRIVLETGQSARWPVTHEDDARLEPVDRSAPEAGALPGSGLVVPMIARGRVVGAIAFRRPTADRPFAPDDQALAEEIGRYAGLGIENIRLEQDAQEAVFAREAERNRLQQILDVLPEGIALSDVRGQIIMSNLAARDIWGQSRPPGQGGSAGFPLWRLSGLPYPDEATPLARSIAHGEEVRGEQMLSENAATGRRVPLLMNSAPLRNTAGTIVGGVAVFQDISPIKDLERQKDAFLAAVSHDLKNPLTTIKSLAQLLQRLVGQIEDRRAGRVLEKLALVDQTATRATSMLNEFVDIARVQMGRPLNLDERPHDLVALAERVINEHQQLTETHTIRIESATPSVTGVWDSVRLTRVLDNLVSNAIKYSPDGGEIVVSVTTERDRSGSWAILHVRDQGLGIPAEEIPHVFERFFRGSNVTGKIGGTGIGLSGARQIVEQHGGKIGVESEEGRGSTFTVRLPLHDPELE